MQSMSLAYNQFDASRESVTSPESIAATKTIVILHGLFGSKRNWQSIARKLSKENQIFTLDLRNHGDSIHSITMNYQEMADDVFQFIADHSLQKVSIVGHSMGGKVAMQLALNHPEIIEKLIIMDISPVQYDHGFDKLIDSLKTLPLEKISSRQEADEYLKSSVKPESLRQFLLQNLQNSGNGFSWRINLEGIQSCIDDLMGFPVEHMNQQFDDRVLFLKGEKSDYIKQKHEKQIFRLFPNALFITVEGAGHWLHAEKPEFVANEIVKFIK